MSDWKARLNKMHARRGECPECGKAKCTCDVAKTAGVLKKGPDGMHLDFIKTLTKDRKWKKDPGGIADHPRREYLKMDSADVKAAAVNPLIRMSSTESPSNGSDVQVPLTQNPYHMTGNPAEGDAQNASEYENGYQFCQGLGHAGLNNAQPEQFESWASRDQAWRDGFAAAADTLGVPNIAEQIDATPKVAKILKLSAILMHPELMAKAPNVKHLFTASNPHNMAKEFPEARRIMAGEKPVDPNAPTEKIIKSSMTSRSMNYLAGGTGFGLGTDYGIRQSGTGLGANDLPEEEMAHVRGKGRALGAVGAGILGGLGGLGLAWSEHAPSEWMDNIGDTLKNFSSGATLGLLGGFVPPAIYGATKGRELAEDEVLRRKTQQAKAVHDASPSPAVQPVSHPTNMVTPAMAS